MGTANEETSASRHFGTKGSWIESGPVEVVSGIFRIPLPLKMDGLRGVNIYAVLGPGGVTLIDAGWAFGDGEQELAWGLGQLGLDLADVDEFLVTHAHRDHYTLGVAVRRRLGTRIRIGVGEQSTFQALATRQPGEETRQVALLRQAGAAHLAERWQALDAHFDKRDWGLPDAWVEDGEEITVATRRLRAIHTPGHTRGHFVYHDEAQRVLFTGDHVLPHITPSIGFEPAPPRSPLSDYLTSLRLLRNRPDALLLPGHGPVSQSVHQRVDELLAHHGARLDQTLSALARGACTAYDVARQLKWTSHSRALRELDAFNTVLAVLETYWHLEVLAERAAVHRQEQHGVVTYEQ